MPDGNHAVHNQHGTPHDANAPALTRAAHRRMASHPLVLTREHASVVASCINSVADRHAVRLGVAAVMPTHVHVVCSGVGDGSQLLQLFKGNTSRRLSEAFGSPEARWWTRGGSSRPKLHADAIDAALAYVRHHEALAWCGLADTPDIP